VKKQKKVEANRFTSTSSTTRCALTSRDRLEDQLEQEERRAEYEYDFCRRSVPVYVANRCVYDDSRIREIKEDIRENKREIRDLKDEKRGW